MKVIITGGRKYLFTPADHAFLDRLHAEYHFTEVVHGAATGADRCADAWAHLRGIETKPFPADWATHGSAAGPIRNSAMVQYVGKEGMMVAFPGGIGTENCVQKGRVAGLDVR